MKVCNRCLELKSLEEFPKRKGYSDGHLGRCKKCESARVRAIQKNNPKKYRANPSRRILRHGISVEKYDDMLSKYNGKCWTCRDNIAENIDHNHSCCPGTFSCGECVRGLLCSHCNRSLGAIRDSINTLENMIEYLSM